MKNKTILLVEDDPKDIELTLLALEEQTLVNDISVVRDGAEALDYLYQRGKFAGREPGNPVLILLDIKLPKIDGLEVLQEIKNNPDLKTIPVVIMTSSSDEQDINTSYKNGTNAYVVKPISFDEFQSAVKQIGLFWLLLNQPPLDSDNL